MTPELFRAGLQMSAVALIFGCVVMLITGSARSVGESFRQSVEPMLLQVRSHTERSRSELADMSIMGAMGLAMLAILSGNAVAGTVIVPLLYLARPAVRRATSQEHRLMAIAGTFSIDLMIGVYLPLALAHLLMMQWFMASSLLAVVLALSWPAGGGETIPGRRWHLAPSPV